MKCEKYNLPSEKHNDYNLGESGIPCLFTTSDVGAKLVSFAPELREPTSWARFVMMLRQTVLKDRRIFISEGVPYVANINWFRDHVHEMKAFKHWENEIKSFISFMVKHQNPEGFFYEMVVTYDNFHKRLVDATCIKEFPEDGLALVRIEIEADIEYLMVEGAFSAYKATGDDEWIKSILPALEKGIDYMTSSPKRWDEAHGLVKRAFTMDTWDFAYDQDPCTDRRIHPQTPMSIMHGDNSGVYQAMCQLAWLNRRFNNVKKAEEWECRAEQLKNNLNKYCWNGKFYTHQLHLNHDGAEDADENAILSLSNTYDMNRGVTSFEQTESIIEEYQRRRALGNSFAEFFCIDPPYEKFKTGDSSYREKNSYVNGGISTFTAGELAKAAFTNGYEEYGWDILCRIREIAAKDNEIYFLYSPTTCQNISGGPSGWGSAALMDSIDSGIAGIVDADVCYNILEFSPKWAITEIEELRYITGYEASKRLVQTDYFKKEDRLVYQLRCPSREVRCHILLPVGKYCSEVKLNGKKVSFELKKIRNSIYVDFTFLKENAIELSERWEPMQPDTIEVIF